MYHPLTRQIDKFTVAVELCHDSMYSNKFGCLMLGLYSRKPAAVCGAIQSGFSRTAVCKRRTLWLQRSACLKTQQLAMTRHVSIRLASQATVDPDELRRFQSLANKWWDEQGEFAALHAMNDLRVPFIRDNLLNVHITRHPGKPLAGLKVLDVGCGGGLLTELWEYGDKPLGKRVQLTTQACVFTFVQKRALEFTSNYFSHSNDQFTFSKQSAPLGRLGASVLGIDPVEDGIGTARLHSSYDPDLRGRVQYQACTLEELSAEEEGGDEEQGAGRFDAVVASEVVEHLADLETFAFCCSRVLKPGGSLFITTINKTNLSYALGIVVAEQLLRIVPSGTHDWEKFVSPVELERLLESNGFSVQSVQGMLYNPVSGAWSWTNSTAINYALHAVKVTDDPRPEGAEEDDDTSFTHN